MSSGADEQRVSRVVSSDQDLAGVKPQVDGDADADADADDDDHQKLDHEGWNDIKDKERKSTDIFFLILICMMWFAMTMVGWIGVGIIEHDDINKGEPSRLVNAIDFNGNICGFDDGVKDLKYGYYLPDTSVVCVEECPLQSNFEAFVCRYELQPQADASVAAGYNLVSDFQCMYVVKTKKFLRRCVPNLDVNIAYEDALAEALSQGSNITSRIVYDTFQNGGSSWFSSFWGDVIELRGYIFGFGVAIAFGFSFAYLYLLRIPGLLKIVIWSTIFLIFYLLIFGSFLLWSLANEWDDDGLHQNYEVVTMRTVAYFGISISVVYFCLMVVLRKRIKLAIGVIKEAARAIGSMPMLPLLPVLEVVGLSMFLAVWLTYMVYLASSGDVVTEVGTFTNGAGMDVTYTYRTFEYSKQTKYAFLYMLFCWFWTYEFVVAVGQLVLSLAVVRWYFIRDKTEINNDNISWAAKTIGTYHLGTAAYGSLIIAIIRTIRAVIAYLQKKAKKSQSKIAEYFLCILGCFVWCLEKIMKFINTHAYILTAIYGYSFCKAARKAFFLLLRNILRVAAVNTIASFILMLGKYFVPILVTFLAYACIAYGTNEDNVTGITSPLILTFLLAYCVSAMFMEVYHMAIETILFCYIADEEMFPEAQNRFAESDLRTTLQETSQKVNQLKRQDSYKVDKSSD